MSPLGRFERGGYEPGADRRDYGDLAQAERMEVVAAYYLALRCEAEERKERLQLEAKIVAEMPDIEARRTHMERVKAERPQEFELLAPMVRVAYRIRVESMRQGALL